MASSSMLESPTRAQLEPWAQDGFGELCHWDTQEMADPFSQGRIRHQGIISSSGCYRDAADVEDSGYDTEQT